MMLANLVDPHDQSPSTLSALQEYWDADRHRGTLLMWQLRQWLQKTHIQFKYQHATPKLKLDGEDLESILTNIENSLANLEIPSDKELKEE